MRLARPGRKEIRCSARCHSASRQVGPSQTGQGPVASPLAGFSVGGGVSGIVASIGSAVAGAAAGAAGGGGGGGASGGTPSRESQDGPLFDKVRRRHGSYAARMDG